MVMVRPQKETFLTSKDYLYVICDPQTIDLDRLELDHCGGISKHGKFNFYGLDQKNSSQNFESFSDNDNISISNEIILKKDRENAKILKKFNL